MPISFLRMVMLSGLALLTGISPSAATDVQKVLGAGPSTKVVTLFFQAFEQTSGAQGLRFQVAQRSTKHAGGIRASGAFLFGRTGRPLNAGEKAKGKFEIFLAGTPVGFVVGKEVGINKLTLNQVRDIYQRKITNWKALGGPDGAISLLGREKGEAAMTVLRLDYPFLDNAKIDRVFKRDHAIVNFLTADIGRYAIGVGAFPNFGAKHIVQVTGHSPVVKLGLVVDNKNAGHPVVKAAQTFAASKTWSTMVRNSSTLLALKL
jgi:hypothetical protein